MIFRQLFDQTSGTYSYLLASRRGGEAMIIDPVLEKVDRYLSLVRELDLKLVKAVDTHMHADHITGLGALRDKTHCITVMQWVLSRSAPRPVMWSACMWVSTALTSLRSSSRTSDR